MSWNRILLFTLICLGATLILTKLSEGASIFEIAFLFILAIGLGYGYGTFQMFYVYEEQVNKAIEAVKNSDE